MEQYEEISFVDDGAFAKIFTGKKDERRIAIKKFNPNVIEKMPEDFVELEAQATKTFSQQKYFPDYYDHSDDYILMEYIEGVPLDFLMNRNFWHQVTSYEEKCRLAIEITKSVKSMRNQNWVHLDISKKNILIENTEKRYHANLQTHLFHFTKKSRVRLVDFGFSREAPQGYKTLIKWCEEKGGMLGKRTYSSPERLEIDCKENPYQQDIFSLGVLLYKIFCLNKHPYIHNENKDIKKQIKDSPLLTPQDALKQKPQNISNGIAKMIEKAIARQPNERYTKVDQILDKLTKDKP